MQDMPTMHSILNNLRIPQLPLPPLLRVGSRLYDRTGRLAQAASPAAKSPPSSSSSSASPCQDSDQAERGLLSASSGGSTPGRDSARARNGRGGRVEAGAPVHRGSAKGSGGGRGAAGALDVLIPAALQLLRDAPPQALLKRTRCEGAWGAC